MAEELHNADPRKDRKLWCSTCKSQHEPTPEHPICESCGGFPHLHLKPPSDIYFNFKGWKFTAPFHCLTCGVEVCYLQWAFSRSCGGCDVSVSHTAKLHYYQWTAGPHVELNPDDHGMMTKDTFVPLEEVAKKTPLIPSKFPPFGHRFGVEELPANE